MGTETLERVREIVEPLLDDLGVELVDIQLRTERNGLVLRITIYKDDGVNLDDCSLVSREVGYLLEVEDPISKAFSLEVSSPGLDRPLKTARDFERNKGKKVTVLFLEIEERHSVSGIVEQVADDQLFLRVARKEHVIPLSEIIKAKLVIEF